MTLRSSHILTIILLATLLVTVPFFAEAATPTAFQNVLWTITVSVFGLFVWMSSAIVDIGINSYVIGFGDNFITSGVGLAVDNLWTTVRDIFNLTFIFGLVFLGFKMILNSDDTSTRRSLIYLILAALLVNFSLFITKAVVDFSNIAATQIAQGFPVVAATGKVSLSQGYMNLLGIQSLLDANTLPGTDQTAYGFIFGTMILFVVMSFVFAAGGILLLIRYVVLCLYMILSPLMFLGWVFPQLQSVSSKYWHGFLSRAFFAPVFLLLVYFSLFVLTALYQTTNTSVPNASLKTSLSAAAPGQMPSFESAFIPFILSAIFLIASIVVANKMGADGASTALRMGKSASSWAQRKAKVAAGGATVGMAARGMRNTVGRGSEALTRSNRFKELAASSALGKYAFKAAQKGAQSSFDVRQVAGLGAATGLGTGAAGGFKKKIADKNKADEQFAKDVHIDYDKNDPKYLAKVKQKEEEIERRKSKDDSLLKERKQLLDEAKGKDAETLNSDISKAREELRKAQEELEKAKKQKDTYTKAELEDFEYTASSKANALAVATFAKEKRDQEQKINSDPKLSDSRKQEELSKLDTEWEAQKESADNQIESLKNKNVRKSAETQVQYATELAYIEQLESIEQFWKRAGTLMTAGLAGNQYATGGVALAGGAGTALAVGAGAAGFAMGLNTAAAQSTLARQSANNLINKYGTDGSKMANTKKQQEYFKAQAEAQKDTLGSEPSVTPPTATPPSPADNK